MPSKNKEKAVECQIVEQFPWDNANPTQLWIVYTVNDDNGRNTKIIISNMSVKKENQNENVTANEIIIINSIQFAWKIDRRIVRLIKMFASFVRWNVKECRWLTDLRLDCTLYVIIGLMDERGAKAVQKM